MAASTTQATVRREPIEALFSGRAGFLDRLPMLRVVLQRAAALCGDDLKGMLHSDAQLTLERLDSGTAGDMLAAHDEASVAGVLHAKKWDARVLVSVDRAAAFAATEAMLGADGSEPPYGEVRPFSKIELRLARILMESLARALAGAFSSIAETPFEVETVTDRIDFEAVGRRSNSVVAAALRAEMLNRSGEILVVIPQSVLKPMRQALAEVPAEPAPVDPWWSQQIQNEITRTSVTVQAVLEERVATLGDIAGFRVGQIIPLDATPHTRVRVESNGEALLSCQLGKYRGAYTLRVEELIDKNQEFPDGLPSG